MRKEEGCLTVEMESAGMMAVAQFRGVVLGQVLYGGDDLSCLEWDERSWQSRTAIREKLFWLCADAVLRTEQCEREQLFPGGFYVAGENDRARPRALCARCPY